MSITSIATKFNSPSTNFMWKHMFNNVGFLMKRQNMSSRKLIVSVLNSTATKREAKDYLTKYTDEPNIINHSVLLIRHLHMYNSKTLKQLSETIRKLRILGLRPICVIPPSNHVKEQAEALDKLITRAKLQPMHIKDALLKRKDGTFKSILSSAKSSLLNNAMPNLVPIVKPYIYDEKTAVEYMSNNIVEFMNYFSKDSILNIDKIFILNRIGGIPSGERNDNAHVFINLSQEFQSLSNSLHDKISSVAKREPNSDDLIDRMNVLMQENRLANYENELIEHLQDLQIMNAVLSSLATSSTGLITTVNSAALTSETNNPLLYNLLTDRSLISSSLPRFKRNKTNDNIEEMLVDEGEENDYENEQEQFNKAQNYEKENYDNAVLATTVLKKGVYIKTYDFKTLNEQNSIGFPLSRAKESSMNCKIERTEVKDINKVDLTKMKKILDQSFHRTLDLRHYMNRINGRIASIIVIGDYEGIAILTYEGPKHNPFVYLDKFAVLPHLKGSLGISDIIFNLMFKKFPKEVVWRSRKDNVVNKWYFQRSVAVVDLSIDVGNNNQVDSNFKLFYYGDPDSAENYVSNLTRLKEFAEYVRDIEPSWEK